MSNELEKNEARRAAMLQRIEKSNAELAVQQREAEERRQEEAAEGKAFAGRRDQFMNELRRQIDELNADLQKRRRRLELVEVRSSMERVNGLVDVAYHGSVRIARTEPLMMINCRTHTRPLFEVIMNDRKFDAPANWEEPDGVQSLLLEFIEQSEN